MIARSLFLATALLASSLTAAAAQARDNVIAAPVLRGNVTVSSDIVRVGDNLFTDTPASGAPQDGIANADGFGDIQQSNLEQANVEVVTEISDLISAQRAYEMNAKVVSAADQMMQSTANMFR